MNKKYLLVRAKPDNKDREDQFLKGILSIGWPNTGEFKEFSRRYLENLLENFEYNKTAITQIESFINVCHRKIRVYSYLFLFKDKI